MNWKRRTVLKLLLSFLCLEVSISEDTNGSSGSSNGDGSELPGHMQPLGSHRPPIKVKRIQHLPTPVEFHRDYVTPKIPVVMEGALNGASAWKKWQNDDYLRSDIL